MDSGKAWEDVYTTYWKLQIWQAWEFVRFPVVCRCRALAAKFLSEKNGDSQHTIHAMGHCHIDSGASYCSLRNAVGLLWPSSNWKSLLVTLMWNVSKVMCIISSAIQPGCGPTQSQSGNVLAAGPLWWPWWRTTPISPSPAHKWDFNLSNYICPHSNIDLSAKFHCSWAYLQYCWWSDLEWINVFHSKS